MAIAAVAMDATTTTDVYPERAPMKVIAATFTLLTARQSRLHPAPYTLHPKP